MASEKLRRRIVFEAARLIQSRQETECYRAKLRAVRKFCRGWLKPADFPADAEIRDELQRLACPPAAGVEDGADDVARFVVYRSLLLPLEQVAQNHKRHPEGDALYHSLQVFELARDEAPYDEEFLLAALLHDVGKAIDPLQHVEAALDALAGTITERTAWLIEHHSEAQRIHEGTIGVRARRRLAASPDFELLLTLAECDRDGRIPGMVVPDVDEALDAVREVSRLNG